MLRCLSQDFGALERRLDHILTESVGDARGMAGRFNIIGADGLDTGSMLEDVTELLSVPFQVFGIEGKAGQARHMGYIDVDGHADSLGGERMEPTRDPHLRRVFVVPRAKRRGNQSPSTEFGEGAASFRGSPALRRRLSDLRLPTSDLRLPTPDSRLRSAVPSPLIVSSTVRIGTGIAALALALAGLIVVLQGGGTTGEVLIRTGVMLAAVWLVAPLIRRPGPATLVGLAAMALVVVRPRLLIPLVVGAVVWWLARRKHTPPSRR